MQSMQKAVTGSMTYLENSNLYNDGILCIRKYSNMYFYLKKKETNKFNVEFNVSFSSYIL